MALSATNNMTAYGTGDTGEAIDVGSGAGWYDLDNLHADFGRLSLIGSFTADYYEGAASSEGCVAIATATAATTVGVVYHDGTGALNLSTNNYVRVTCKFGETSKMGTKAQGGIRVIVMDSSNNYAEWYVGGSNDYSGDWEQYLVDTSTTADNTSTTGPTMTDIDFIGVSSYYGTKPAKAENIFVDAQWYGSDPSITVTGTVAVAGVGWSELELYAQDVTRRYGVIRLRNGIYEIRGGMKFGDAAGSSPITFSDETNAKLRYPPAPVGSLDSVSEILLQGNATTPAGDTNFTLGDLVGGAGLLGGSIFSDGVAFTFDSDTNAATIEGCDLWGVSFEGAGVIKMDNASNQTMTSCQLVGCGQFDPGAAVVEQCKFIDTTDTGGALLWNDSADVTESQFIANTTGAGVEHATIESVYTGTADDPGSSTTVLYDAGATFTGGAVNVGEYIYNENDHCYAKVVSIDDANTITHEALTGGTADDWANGDAYSISPAQAYTDLTFSGNTVDVANTATGSDGLFVTKSGTSDPNTETGNTVFIASVDVVITVKDVGGNLISDVQTSAFKTSDRVQIMNEDTVAGVATEAYTGSTPVEVEIRCRKASGGTNYLPFSSIQTVGTGGLDFAVTMIEDGNNAT